MEGHAGRPRVVATILIPEQADQDARRLSSVVGQECPKSRFTCKNDPCSRVEGLCLGVLISRFDARRLNQSFSSGRYRAMPQQPHTLLPKADKSAPQASTAGRPIGGLPG